MQTVLNFLTGKIEKPDMLLFKTRKSQYDRTTQHGRFVAVVARPLAHFASATLQQNAGYAGNVRRHPIPKGSCKVMMSKLDSDS